MITSPILRHAVGLGLFAVFTAGLIAGVHLQTQDRARTNAEAYAARTLYELVPEDYYDAPLEDEPVSLLNTPHSVGVDRLTLRHDRPAFRVRREGEVTAMVLPATSTRGYTGDIDLLLAVDRQGEILGVRVVAHQETPGLGDAIEADRNDWILQFEGKSLGMPPPEQWAVRKDGGEFDQLTGATITPRAVVSVVRQGLEFFADNRDWLLAE